MAAIFLRPGHADPAAFADPLGKAGNVVVAALRAVRIEGALCDLLGEKGADFLAQFFAFFGQADRIETEGCGHFICRKDLKCQSRGNGSEPPLPWGEGWGEGVRSFVRLQPLTRIASVDAIRPLPSG